MSIACSNLDTKMPVFSVSAMKFLQDNNVAHMDLKPQNILCTTSSDPVLKIAGRLYH